MKMSYYLIMIYYDSMPLSRLITMLTVSTTETTTSFFEPCVIIQDGIVKDIDFEFLYGQINMKNHAADDVSVVLIQK